MKKKIAVLLCALSLAFCFTGCVNGQQINTELSALIEEEKTNTALKAIEDTLLIELTEMEVVSVKLKPTNGIEGSITLTVADGNVTVTLNDLYVDTSKSISSSYTEAKFTENIQKSLGTIANGTYKAFIRDTNGGSKIADVRKIG